MHLYAIRNFSQNKQTMKGHASIRRPACPATVAINDLELHQMDVVTAFSHGDIDKDIYNGGACWLQRPVAL